jgi:hypothetical protein
MSAGGVIPFDTQNISLLLSEKKSELFSFIILNIRQITSTFSGPVSVVGIATGYGLDGPGIKSRWGEIFRTCPDRPWCPPSHLYNGYRVFPRGKERPGRDADPSPTSNAVIKKK